MGDNDVSNMTKTPTYTSSVPCHRCGSTACVRRMWHVTCERCRIIRDVAPEATVPAVVLVETDRPK